MSSSRPNFRFAAVALQVIREQVRPITNANSLTSVALQPRSLQDIVRALMPRASPKDWIRVSFDLTLSVFLWVISAVHIYHGALIFHGVVVSPSVQPGRACASSSFLIDPSTIGVVDPNFCYNMRLEQPVLSCSSIGTDTKVNALFDISNTLFLAAKDCAATQNSSIISEQCRAFLASKLFPDTGSAIQSQSSAFLHLSKFCSSSMAHMVTSAGDSTIEISSITSLAPSFSLPSSEFQLCSCDAAWAIISVDGRGGGALSATKFLLQDPPKDSSDVKILEGLEADAVNCHGKKLGPACAMPTAVRTSHGPGCACLQWIHFKSNFWWLLLLLQMTAAAAAWLREGAALLLPVLSYRDVDKVSSMNFSLPCAIATAVWRPHELEVSPSRIGQQGDDFRLRWLQHFQNFTLAQHLPMFIGSYFFARAVSMTDDKSLQLPSTYVAALAAIAGWGLR
jgi:hypothetical protein